MWRYLANNLIKYQVGQQFILDATQEEQACAVGSLALAVTASGKIAALFKAGTGSLHPENVMDVIEASGTAIFNQFALHGHPFASESVLLELQFATK